MDKLLSGIISFFMSLGLFFHPGQTSQTNKNQIPSITQTPHVNLYPSKKPGENNIHGFSGIVKNINGYLLTVEPMNLLNENNSAGITPSISPPARKTLEIILNSTTSYNNGTKKNITVDTKITGLGKLNSDGTITATSININPAFPSISKGKGGILGPVPQNSKTFKGIVVKNENSTLTLKTLDNKKQIIITLDPNTEYFNLEPNNIQLNTIILGFGKENSDKTITAEKIKQSSPNK